MTQESPWVTLKWAQSADGFMDPDADAQAGRGGIALTGHAAARHTHSLRATHDAILVGMRTWLVDRPSLTTRHVPGTSPRKFILTRGETPIPEEFEGQRWWEEPGVLVHPASAMGHPALTSWSGQGFELLPLESSTFSSAWWNELRSASGMLACLVEGGAEVAQAVLDQGTWQEVHMLQAPHILGQGLRSPKFDHPASEGTPMGDDVLYVCQNDMNLANHL
jgi:diaminohydroxyphosphoribosylaminopyrimidine deaminase/5-amino-6-(5-phosphoribosylamino)uracil reductase